MDIYFDGHCDTLSKAFDENKDLKSKDFDFNISNLDLNIPRIQTLATFVNPRFENGFKRAKNIIDYYYNINDDIILIKNKNNLNDVLEDRKIGVILSIENGKAIENDLNNIDVFFDKGIRMMGITWNDDNFIGCGCYTKADNGLTDFGIKYIKKLEDKNIIIDVSHCSEQTFWDTYRNTNKIIVATHSCCYGICRNKRNLKDKQIKAIASRGGIIGICFSNIFLNEFGKADVKDLVNHIDYIINLVGEDYVGLGSDFDGLENEHKLKDINNVSKILLLEDALIKKNYTRKRINKIMGLNWIRVFRNII